MANVLQFTSQPIFVPDLGTKNNRSSHQVRCTPWPRHVTQSASLRVDTDISDVSSLQISQPAPVPSSRPLNPSHLTPEVDPNVLKQADAVRKESLQCSALVARMGRGAVYLGSSRIGEGHSFFQRAQDLSSKVRSCDSSLLFGLLILTYPISPSFALIPLLLVALLFLYHHRSFVSPTL